MPALWWGWNNSNGPERKSSLTIWRISNLIFDANLIFNALWWGHCGYRRYFNQGLSLLSPGAAHHPGMVGTPLQALVVLDYKQTMDEKTAADDQIVKT